ncbi:GNAT family N-acetyltransferase [Exiguobacterium sp. SH0S1]|nr:GNAT family N-acetyltransferase [Exiguobacterium sp. SH0S1]
MMVHPEGQGKGLGRNVLEFSERLAVERGYASIRLDSFTGNEAACNFYKRHGYVECGNVHFDSKPKGHERYVCFEKELV